MQRLTCDAAMVDQRPRYRDGRGIGEQIDVGPLDRQHSLGFTAMTSWRTARPNMPDIIRSRFACVTAPIPSSYLLA